MKQISIVNRHRLSVSRTLVWTDGNVAQDYVIKYQPGAFARDTELHYKVVAAVRAGLTGVHGPSISIKRVLHPALLEEYK